MNERPPIADKVRIINGTFGDNGARALGEALVDISRQLDRIIDNLEKPSARDAHFRAVIEENADLRTRIEAIPEKQPE